MTMVTEIAAVNSTTKVDPNVFDVTMVAILSNAKAHKYIDIFRKQNLGQTTLGELTDEDLIKLGVDDPDVRNNIIKSAVKYLTQRSEKYELSNLTMPEIISIIENSAEHLSKIYLSLVANRLALKKANSTDQLIHEDQYTSDIAISTLKELTKLLDEMDHLLYSKTNGLIYKRSTKKTKKIIVGTIGGAVVATLCVFFVKSLKQLN